MYEIPPNLKTQLCSLIKVPGFTQPTHQNLTKQQIQTATQHNKNLQKTKVLKKLFFIIFFIIHSQTCDFCQNDFFEKICLKLIKDMPSNCFLIMTSKKKMVCLQNGLYYLVSKRMSVMACSKVLPVTIIK